MRSCKPLLAIVLAFALVGCGTLPYVPPPQNAYQIPSFGQH